MAEFKLTNKQISELTELFKNEEILSAKDVVDNILLFQLFVELKAYQDAMAEYFSENKPEDSLLIPKLCVKYSKSTKKLVKYLRSFVKNKRIIKIIRDRDKNKELL